MSRKPKRPITKNVMQGIDEWNDGFGKIFREFIEEIQQNSFNRGVQAKLGRFGNKPVPDRDYSPTKSLRKSILYNINGACKLFEDAHGVKIPHKGGLTKRIAGQIESMFERYEKFIVDSERKKGPTIKFRFTDEDFTDEDDGG